MDSRTQDPDARQHAVAVEYTLKELQRKISEHEAELDKVSSPSYPRTFLASYWF